MTPPVIDRPVRVQLSRKKGWRMPENTVKVTRPGPYGNPFVVGERPGMGFSRYHRDEVKDAAQAVALFRRLLLDTLLVNDASVDLVVQLRGKNLACFCPLDQPCHADVLLELANPHEVPS